MISRLVHRNAVHVWSKDPALDKTGNFDAAWDAFTKSGDVSMLPLRDGQRPTVFRIASLKRRHFIGLGDVTDREKLIERCDRMVSLGLIGVENFVDEAGRQLALQFAEDGRGGKVLKEETLQELFYPDLIIELGLRILEISSPDPPSGQG